MEPDAPFYEDPAYVSDDDLRRIAHDRALSMPTEIGTFSLGSSKKPSAKARLADSLFDELRRKRDGERPPDPPDDWYL